MKPYQVLALQKFINRWLPKGYTKLKEDGDWGTLTSDAFEVVFKQYAIPKGIPVVEPKEVAPSKNIHILFNNYGNGYTKDEWFKVNRDALMGIVDRVNKRGGNGLTYHEVFAVMYAELGLSRGKVNPRQVHSENEYGVFPLPSNLRFWTDETAPTAEDTSTPPVRNVYWFIRYLHGLKNRAVGKALKLSSGKYSLYRDLWKYRKIESSPEKSANLLAAIVHGYFYSQNFTERKVSNYEKILDRIADGKPAHEQVKDTTYRHEGKSMMVGRSANIEVGMSYV